MSYIDTRELVQELADLREREDGEGLELDAEDRERMTAIADALAAVGAEAEDGVTLIPEDEFEDHARELAEDIGAIAGDAQWPATCIDWERAARELRMDYTEVEFDGDTYLVRA